MSRLSLFLSFSLIYPTLSATSTGYILPVNRRALNHPVRTHDFNFDFTHSELQGVLRKYRLVREHTILLNPENDISDFVDGNYPDVDSMIDRMLAVGSVDEIAQVTEATVFPALNGTLPLVDEIQEGIDLLYYGDVGLGTPAQVFGMDIDTGSADLWVPCGCDRCWSKQYEPHKSSTYRRRKNASPFDVTYGTGWVHGTTAVERVQVAGIVVEDQTFAAISHKSSDFDSYSNDGILGLAFSTTAQCHEYTIVENAILQKKVNIPVFSVHLERGHQEGSELCIGCLDPSKALGPPSWNQVISRAYWSISLKGFTAHGSWHLFSMKLSAAIDTGTTLIYLPNNAAEQLYSKIPGARNATEYGVGFYTYPCNSDVKIELVFDNRPHSIHPDDFNQGVTGSDPSRCVGGILAMPDDSWPSNLAIVGDEFLKSWYATFDYSSGGRVGFAPSINNRLL
ncbi:hypothetical protein PM082_001587 [Marasmius tenuissimus]|nr:hypothetical protein PM082_001587 [Marasmius tenuissimus]